MRERHVLGFPDINTMRVDTISIKATEIKKYVTRAKATIDYRQNPNQHVLPLEEEHMKENLIRQIAQNLLEDGFITFKKGFNYNHSIETMEAELKIFDYQKFQEDFEPEYVV